MNNPMMFIDPDARSSQSLSDAMIREGGIWENVGYGFFNSDSGQYMDFDGKILKPSEVIEQRSYVIEGGTGGGSGGELEN